MAFPSTHLSLVERAAHPDAPGWEEAWERFFRGYWPPLYAYLRRSGSPSHEALDLVQDLFLAGAHGTLLRSFDPQRGRLRSFLLTCLQNLRRKAFRREQRRPDRLPWLSEAPEPVAGDPEEAFDREWMRRTQERAIGALGARLEAEGDGVAARVLQEWVLAPERPPAKQLAQELGIASGALYTRATRLRRALVAEVEQQVAALTGAGPEAAEERDAILRALRGSS